MPDAMGTSFHQFRCRVAREDHGYRSELRPDPREREPTARSQVTDHLKREVLPLSFRSVDNGCPDNQSVGISFKDSSFTLKFRDTING